MQIEQRIDRRTRELDTRGDDDEAIVRTATAMRMSALEVSTARIATRGVVESTRRRGPGVCIS